MNSRLMIQTILLSIISICANSQSNERTYLQQINKFFALIKDGKYGESIDYIYSTNRWTMAKSDDIASMKANVAGLTSMVGEFCGYESIAEEYIGSRYVVCEYMALFERQPLRVYFRFYRPKDDWVIEGFGYKADLDEWLHEKSKNKFLYLRSSH